jgi:hypothetical protein
MITVLLGAIIVPWVRKRSAEECRSCSNGWAEVWAATLPSLAAFWHPAGVPEQLLNG